MIAHVTVRRTDPSQVGEARRTAQRMAEKAGRTEVERGHGGHAATELATNLLESTRPAAAPLLQVLRRQWGACYRTAGRGLGAADDERPPPRRLLHRAERPDTGLGARRAAWPPSSTSTPGGVGYRGARREGAAEVRQPRSPAVSNGRAVVGACPPRAGVRRCLARSRARRRDCAAGGRWSRSRARSRPQAADLAPSTCSTPTHSTPRGPFVDRAHRALVGHAVAPRMAAAHVARQRRACATPASATSPARS